MVRSELLLPRRKLLAGMGASLALVGCGGNETLFLPKTKEFEKGPVPLGDVGRIGNMYYHQRNGLSYELNEQEFALYRRNTKFDLYGRKIVDLSPALKPQNPQRVNPLDTFYMGKVNEPVKKIPPGGGEMTLHFSGFTDEDGVPYVTLSPQEHTFAKIDKRLEVSGFTSFENLYFTYGETERKQYDLSDTLRDPKVNIKLAIGQIEDLMKALPLVQFNIVAHSLGGIFAMAVAQRHPEAINNITLLSSPIRGLEPTAFRLAVAKGLPAYLKTQDITAPDEYVTKFLFDLWKNDKYQKELDDFIKWFTSSGKHIEGFVYGADPIVPVASARILDSNLHIEGKEVTYGSMNPLEFYSEVTRAMKDAPNHGKTLTEEKIINLAMARFGRNLASAA